MNIFESPALMTVIDVVIVVCAAFAVSALVRIRAKIRFLRLTGLVIATSGLLLVAGFFLFDLATMWVLPAWVGASRAHEVMVDLHLNWSWIVLLAAALALTWGLIASAKELSGAEHLLGVKDNLYRSIVEDQSELIVRWLPDGTRTFVNDAYCRYRQASRDDLVGKSFFHLLLERDRARVKPGLAKLTPERPTAVSCHPSIAPDGELRWQEWTDHGLFDEAGRLVEIQSVGREVTERQKIEEELRTREMQYQAMFQASMSGLTVRSLEDGSLLEVNAAMAEIFGYSVEEFRKLATEEYVAPEALPLYPEMLATVARGERFSFAVKGIHRDGRTLELDGYFVPFVFDGTRQVLGLTRDITERRRILEELRKSEKALRSLFEQAPDAIRVQDLHGRVLDVNPAACALYGCGRDELLGRDVIELIPEADRLEAQEKFGRIAKGELTWGEGHALSSDGSITPLSIRVNRFEHDGEPALLFHLTDITEQRQLESQLRQAQRMEAVGRLAGGIAHDFNNLLTAIMGYSELVQDEIGSDNASSEDVLEIQKAAERAAELTRQLLAFSRQQVLKPQLLDVNSIVFDIQKLCQRTLGDNVTLELRLDRELGRIRIDKSQLEQVLLNLAINARDAMPDGGTLVLETQEVVLDETYAGHEVAVPPGSYAALSVTDNGSGMSEEVRNRVFEPFFTTKAPDRGTGLGLATVYGIVKQSGGYIWAYSELGIGTTFKILLPLLLRGALAAEATPDMPALVAPEKTLLLVDDNPTVLALAKRTLEDFGYRALATSNGEEALSLAQDKRGEIDLLVTDLVLPGIDGVQLAHELRCEVPGLRVLLMTGYSKRSSFGGKAVLEGEHFLQKPFVRRDLLEAVERALLSTPEQAEASPASVSYLTSQEGLA